MKNYTSLVLEGFCSYWTASGTADINKLNVYLNGTFSSSKRLVLTSLLSALAVLLQSAGNTLPLIGYIISPFASAPIIICTIISIPLGIQAYLLTFFLLIFIQPSEAFIFPFTTGILGIGIGVAFLMKKRRISVIVLTSILLFCGICLLLYLIRFPILGPTVNTEFSYKYIALIYLFCFVYSLLWVEMSRKFLIKISKILTHN